MTTCTLPTGTASSRLTPKNADPVQLQLLERTLAQIRIFEQGIADVNNYAADGQRDAEKYGMVTTLLVVSAIGRLASVMVPLMKLKKGARLTKEGVEAFSKHYEFARSLTNALKDPDPIGALLSVLGGFAGVRNEKDRGVGTLAAASLEYYRARSAAERGDPAAALDYPQKSLALLGAMLEVAAGYATDLAKELGKHAAAISGAGEVVEAIKEIREAVEARDTKRELIEAISDQRDHAVSSMRVKLTALYRQRDFLYAALGIPPEFGSLRSTDWLR
jgi:hypothetical protein